MIVDGITYRTLLLDQADKMVREWTDTEEILEAVEILREAFIKIHDPHLYDLSKTSIPACAFMVMDVWVNNLKEEFKEDWDSYPWLTELEEILEDLCLCLTTKDGNSSSATHLRAS